MTLIVNRYPYNALTRENIDGQRKYQTPAGPVPSVTTILDKTKDKSHLMQWRKRVGEAKAQEITTEAASVGTRMHKYLEEYVETGIWKEAGSNPYAQQANHMALQILNYGLTDVNEIWGSEVNLYMPGIYAGTTDLVGLYNHNPSILDFKQTNKPKLKEWIDDYYLQLTAYALAHNELYGTNIREGHVFMCSRDLQYQQFDLWPDEFDHWANRWWTRCEEYYSQFG
jgi:genome maintenance exonuclease 1